MKSICTTARGQSGTSSGLPQSSSDCMMVHPPGTRQARCSFATPLRSSRARADRVEARPNVCPAVRPARALFLSRSTPLRPGSFISASQYFQLVLSCLNTKNNGLATTWAHLLLMMARQNCSRSASESKVTAVTASPTGGRTANPARAIASATRKPPLRASPTI